MFNKASTANYINLGLQLRKLKNISFNKSDATIASLVFY